MIKHRIEELRKLMAQWGWSAAVTVGEDPHNSEYTPLRWCQREFISGFTGSAGVVVVTADHAGLWTDSRYYIQAERELKGSGIELHRMSSPECKDWIGWIIENMPQGAKVGVDGLCMSMSDAGQLGQGLAGKDGCVVSSPDYLENLWPDRPSLPKDKVWIHPEEYAGRSVSDKLSWLRTAIAGKGCSYMLVSTLDQIAWLLNIRSNDIQYSPFVISFALVTPTGVELFVLEEKITQEVRSALGADGISIHPYSQVGQFIASMTANGKIRIDPSSLNYEIGKAIYESFGTSGIVESASPVELAKAIKNSVEIEGFRKAYLTDGIIQTKFFHWLESKVQSGAVITESDASDKLHELRCQVPEFIDESFETISAYGENAALPHYTTVRGKDAVINPSGLYLNDSGAHFSYGTTDITRTVPMGPLTDLEMEDYTLDMKAMIDLAMAIFPTGTPGCRLDAVARKPLWQTMRNFGHGTGHGVGSVLGVHEGPQTIRQNLKDQPMVAGMITSDEPGIYREGFHGIRHENMILCVPKGENEFGSWLGFETLTLTYLDTGPVIADMLDREEKRWLNGFNAMVYEKVSPYLDESDADWLRKKTRPI